MDYLLIEDLKLQIEDIKQEIAVADNVTLIYYLQDKINDLKQKIKIIEKELKDEEIKRNI